ncbi:MAG: heparinase II/III domain-containing protein, partial [Phycisphaeraceae bacterium]
VIGTAGRWLIADPGYQQYLATNERQFTTGPTAHNCPHIAGTHQTRRGAVQVLRREQIDEHTWHTAIDMTGCYELDALQRAVRHLWLIDRRAVVLADEITCEADTPLAWHWHAHPDLAWWVEPRRVLLYHDHDARHLWLSAPQLQLDESMVHRLPGSRGQLTLIAERTVDTAQSCTWWLFQCEPTPAAPAEVDQTRCHWLDHTFRTA